VVVDELAAHLAQYRVGEWLLTTEAGEPLGLPPVEGRMGANAAG